MMESADHRELFERFVRAFEEYLDTLRNPDQYEAVVRQQDALRTSYASLVDRLMVVTGWGNPLVRDAVSDEPEEDDNADPAVWAVMAQFDVEVHDEATLIEGIDGDVSDCSIPAGMATADASDLVRAAIVQMVKDFSTRMEMALEIKTRELTVYPSGVSE